METGKRCLIVVDYQKDFVDGSLGFERQSRLTTGLLRKSACITAAATT